VLDKVRCTLDGHDRCIWECRWRDEEGAKP
jgi:hypothetical protein